MLPAPALSTLVTFERISDLDSVEFLEVGIVRVEYAHIVLSEDRNEVRVRHQIDPDGHGLCRMAEVVPEPVLLGQHSAMGKSEERFNVRHSHVGRERLGENPGMGRNA